jgi:hypothetical protein
MSGKVIDALAWWARVTPNAVAVDFDGDAGSYRQLSRRAAGPPGWRLSCWRRRAAR